MDSITTSTPLITGQDIFTHLYDVRNPTTLENLQSLYGPASIEVLSRVTQEDADRLAAYAFKHKLLVCFDPQLCETWLSPVPNRGFVCTVRPESFISIARNTSYWRPNGERISYIGDLGLVVHAKGQYRDHLTATTWHEMEAYASESRYKIIIETDGAYETDPLWSVKAEAHLRSVANVLAIRSALPKLMEEHYCDVEALDARTQRRQPSVMSTASLP